jgi:hypothetical protein
LKNEQENLIDKMNSQIDEFKLKLKEKDEEFHDIIIDLEEQKQLNAKSPSNTMKALIEKLKQQLQEKEQQQNALSKALSELRSDMVNITKNTLLSVTGEQNQFSKLMNERIAELQDKNNALEEELLKSRKELKLREKINEDLSLEVEHLTSQLSIVFLFLIFPITNTKYSF